MMNGTKDGRRAFLHGAGIVAGLAAADDALWPHALALAWQGLWVAIFVTMGARLFRRGVLQSGSAQPFWRRKRA